MFTFHVFIVPFPFPVLDESKPREQDFLNILLLISLIPSALFKVRKDPADLGMQVRSMSKQPNFIKGG